MESLPRYSLGRLRVRGQKPRASGSYEVVRYKSCDSWLAEKETQRETEFLWNSGFIFFLIFGRPNMPTKYVFISGRRRLPRLTLSPVHFFKHWGRSSKWPVWVAPLTKLHSVLIKIILVPFSQNVGHAQSSASAICTQYTDAPTSSGSPHREEVI